MISEDYIMKLVREYAKSPAGKTAIKKQTGLIYTDEDPSTMLTAYGEQMKNILYEHVHALIRSIILDDIVVRKPYQDKNGMWKLEISFKDGVLKRDSLDTDNYPEGVYNIVLLFAKGYHAKKYVYGHWYLPNQTWYGGGDFVHIRSKKDRNGSDFLIQAVNEFNENVGKGIAKAELLGDYKRCSENRK